MAKVSCRTVGVAVALLASSVCATSYARYTFGRLASEAGGVLARDETIGCPSSPRVQDNVKLEAVYRHNGIVENYTLWGQAARTELAYMGLPIEIDDDGVNTCAQYSGNVYLKFQAENGSTFWVTGSDPDNSFSSSFWVYDSRISGSLANGEVEIWKRMGCSGHNEWRTQVGTGGPGYSWVANITYFKSG